MATIRNLQVDGDFHYYQDSYLYQENMVHLRGDTYYYSDYGQVKIEFLEDLFEIPEIVKKRKLIQFLREYHSYTDFSWTKFREDVVKEIFCNYSMKTMKDFVNDLECFGIEITPKFDRFVSRGYSQGDSVEVFIPYKLQELYGVDSEQFEKETLPDLYTYIDHICWDSEVSGTFNISFEYDIVREGFGDTLTLKFDEEFEYPEWANDCWKLDINVEAVINYINRKTYNNLDAESLALIEKDLKSFDYTDIKY